MWASKGLTAIIFEEYVVTVAFDPAPDGRVVAFTMVTAMLFGLLLTLLPAWQATREQPLGLQQRTARTVASAAVGHLAGRGANRAVAGAVDRGRSLRPNAANHPVGAVRPDVAGVVVAYSFPRPEGYRHVDNDVYYRSTIEKLIAIPGMERASVSLDKPARRRHGDRRTRDADERARRRDERH